MKKPIIYLIGPISGISYDQATLWRKEAKEQLEDMGYIVLDPMSGQECLKGESKIGINLENSIVVTNQYIYHSDIYKVNRADVLLANLLSDSATHSLGTYIEIGYAIAKDKLVIVVTKDNNIYKHPFIEYSCIVVSSMEMAYEVLDSIYK